MTSKSTIAKAATSTDRPEKPYEVRAERPLGLLLRVQPTGARTFYVQVGRGRRIRIGRADVYTLKKAEEEAKKILLDPDAAASSKRAAGSLREYIDDHYEEHALAQMKNGADSVKRVKTAWKPLLSKRIADITANEIDRQRNKRLLAGKAPATVNRDVSALSGVLAHWSANTKGSKHPLAGVVAPLKVPDDEKVRYLTAVESTRLRKALADRDTEAAKERASANEWRKARAYPLLPAIEAYSDHLTPMVLLSLNTGVRQGELFSLEWSSVDLPRKTLTVLARHAKGNATRTIPLNVEAHQVLKTIRPEGATGLVFKSPKTGEQFDNVKKAWAELTKKAKLPDLRWHDLRHDFASQLVMRGVPLFTVQKLLGHANSKMTQRYAKLAPDTLADAVSKLGTGNG